MDGGEKIPYNSIRTGEGGRTVRIEFREEPGCGEPRVVLVAPARTEEVEGLLRRLSAAFSGPITGWQGDRAALLEQGDILRFYGADKAVFAQTAAGEFRVKERLYELEEKLDRHSFVRISQSEIVNLRQVTALDLTLTGTIKMTLARGGAVCWVSRRYVKKIKEALGL